MRHGSFAYKVLKMSQIVTKNIITKSMIAKGMMSKGLINSANIAHQCGSIYMKGLILSIIGGGVIGTAYDVQTEKERPKSISELFFSSFRGTINGTIIGGQIGIIWPYVLLSVMTNGTSTIVIKK